MNSDKKKAQAQASMFQMKKTQIHSRSPQVDTQACVRNVGNMFDMIIIASMRARELAKKGSFKPIVDTLLELQNGIIGEHVIADLRK